MFFLRFAVIAVTPWLIYLIHRRLRRDSKLIFAVTCCHLLSHYIFPYPNKTIWEMKTTYHKTIWEMKPTYRSTFFYPKANLPDTLSKFAQRLRYFYPTPLGKSPHAAGQKCPKSRADLGKTNGKNRQNEEKNNILAKKLPKYLVVSKKYSTFAPAFENDACRFGNKIRLEGWVSG